jgi:hypothetical protein
VSGSPSSSHLDDNRLVAFLAGALPPQRVEEVEAHLDTCSDCRRLVAEFAATSIAPPQKDGALADEALLQAASGMPFPGQVLADRFELKRLLGRGAMGLVFAAEDRLLKVPVAIKLLSPELAAIPRFLQQLHKEIVIGRRVSHPNVCRIHDLGMSGTLHFIIMEWVEGETLEARIERGALAAEDAARILSEVSFALEAAHREGVVHRDLKPTNIMLLPGARIRVKVMDFGLAHDVESETSVHGPVGTPAYWSPEQAAGQVATPASDLFSLGVVASRLFGGDWKSRSSRTVPRPWRRVVRRCLQTQPSLRYWSAWSFRQALKRARFEARLRRHPIARLAVPAAAAAVVGAIAIVATWKDRPAPPAPATPTPVAVATTTAAALPPAMPTPPPAVPMTPARTATVTMAPSPEAIPVATPGISMASRVDELERERAQKGLLPEDLPDWSAQRAVALSGGAGADAAIGTMAAALETTRVDAEFVRKKLERLTARSHAATLGPDDSHAIEAAFADVHSAYFAGDYRKADDGLNRIAEILGAAR